MKVLGSYHPGRHAEKAARYMDYPDVHTAIVQARRTAARSFIVQLCNPEQPTAAKALGRIENVATGESAYFYSMPELEEFMRRTSSDCR